MATPVYSADQHLTLSASTTQAQVFSKFSTSIEINLESLIEFEEKEDPNSDYISASKYIAAVKTNNISCLYADSIPHFTCSQTLFLRGPPSYN